MKHTIYVYIFYYNGCSNVMKKFIMDKLLTKSMEYLIKKRGRETVSKRVQLLNTSKLNSSNIFSKESMKILKLLSSTPMYPREIAKKIGMNEQTVYYHIKKMKNNGLLKIAKEELKNGAVARYYTPTAEVFGIEVKKEGSVMKKADEKINDFFYEFINNNVFNGSIVVGAPHPHGPYLTYSRDGHCGIQLVFLLGGLCNLPNKFIAKLDTEVKSEKKEKRNLILIGGPITNTITSSIQNYLKVNFIWKNKWVIKSLFTNKVYTDENISVIAKIKNPWDSTKTIILFAGLKFEGTKASIIALTQYSKKLLKNYKGGEFYAIIKGLDRDGDGRVDDILILESH